MLQTLLEGKKLKGTSVVIHKCGQHHETDNENNGDSKIRDPLLLTFFRKMANNNSELTKKIYLKNTLNGLDMY